MCNNSINSIQMTEKQQLILQLMSEGFTAKAISIETGISVDTVNYHKRNIFLILGVNSTVEAVAKAYKMKLIT